MPTALIVEDHPDQAEVAAKMVQYKGFETIVAETGGAGLALAREVKPELVLLDLMLSDIDGFEVCRLLRSRRDTLLIPIVMITALAGLEHRKRGFRVGANAYLVKPFGIDDLYREIEHAISWRRRLELGRLSGEILLEIDSETAFLEDVNDFLTNLWISTPLTHEQIQQLRHALMEMGQNAIEWGNRHKGDAVVRFTYRIHPDSVEVVIADQGEGFDISRLEHAAKPEDPLAHMEVRERLGLREGGFGLLIARGMVDELRYNDRGNEVTLVKRFSRVTE